MNIKEMTSKQIAKEIIERKVINKLNDEFIKQGFEELRSRNVCDITTAKGMIYSVDESVRKKTDDKKLNTFLNAYGKQLSDFQEDILVDAHYVVKPNK